MAVFTHPARAQFSRLTEAGQTPAAGQPGSFAINLVDRKLWTFEQSGAPVPISTDISQHDPSRAYAPGQPVVQDGGLWVAKHPLEPKAFSASDWELITAENLLPPSEPSITGLLEGGALTLSGGQIGVSAGSGVIVDGQDPDGISHTPVSWASTSVTVPANGAAARAVVVTAGGAIVGRAIDITFPRTRREDVVLGFVEYDQNETPVRVSRAPRVARRAGEDLGDMIEALGGAFIVSGAELSAGSGRTLTLAAGEVFSPAIRWSSSSNRPNQFVLPAADPIAFDVRRSDGALVLAAQTEIPLGVYSGGSVPDSFSAVGFLLVAADNSKKWLQLGEQVFPDTGAAIAALSEEWMAVPQAFRVRPDVLTLGAVVMENTSDYTAQGFVFPIVKGPQVAGEFSVPRGATGFLRTDGSSSMQGTLDLNGNSVQNAVIDEGVF